MATDLERLVVQLSADIKGYENALKRAGTQTNRAAAQIENRFNRMNKSIQTSFGGLDRSIKAFGAGFVGAFGAQQLTQMVRAVAAAADAIGDLAQQTGATVESIQILRYAAQQTGSSAEQMDAAIAKLAVNLGEAQKGSGDLAKLLKANGIALKDAAGHARSFNDIFNDVVSLVQRAPDQFAALEVVTTAFGAKNDELVTTLRDGTAGIDAWGRKLAEVGNIHGPDAIAALSNLDAKFNDTMKAMEGALGRLVVAFGPMIDTILDEVIEFAKTLGEIADTIDLLFKGKYAEAGRLATYGRETTAARVDRERLAVSEDIARVEQEIVEVRSRIVNDPDFAGILQQRLNVLEEERKGLQERQLQLETEQEIIAARRRLEGQRRAGAVPTAPTVIPPAGGGGGAATFDAMAVARGYIGAQEIRDADILSNLFKQAGMNVDPKMTAWCAAFVNAVLATGGITGTGSLMAKSFLGFGEKTEEPRVGDIVVLSREGGGHVGFFGGYGATGNVQVLGGNQGDAVSMAEYDPSRVLGYRRIPGVETGAAAVGANVDEAIAARVAAEKEVADALIAQNEELAKQQALVNEANWERYLEERTATIEQQTAQLDAMRDLSSDVLGGIVSDLRAGASAGEIFANVLDKIISRLADMAINSLTTALFGPSGTALPGLLGGLLGAPAIAGARASGGPVMAGSSYMVGEAGPEIFTPSVGGSILPNSRGGMMDVRNRVSVEPSPLFVVTVQSETRRMKRETMAEMPGYLADQQKRLSRG